MPDEHTIPLVEMAPQIGSRLILREEVKVDHPVVAEVTLHIRLKRPLPDESQLGIQFKLGEVNELEAKPAPAALPGAAAQVPPRAAQALTTTIGRLGRMDHYTGTVVASAGANQGVVRGMMVLLSKHGPEHFYAKGTVVFVDHDECVLGFAKNAPEPDVEPGDHVYLRARYDGEPDAP